MTVKMSEFKDEVQQHFRDNNLKDLEKKIIERINDVIISLTRKMADRQETKKHTRILEKQVKNLFEIISFTIQGGAP